MTNWERNIRKVVPYTPGEQPNQPDMIKLNTNENPYPPAPRVQQVLKEMDAGESAALSGSNGRDSGKSHRRLLRMDERSGICRRWLR